MQTKLIKIDADDPNKEDMREAAEIIRSGGLVAFPTETVYGLGANALDPEASKRIYAAKGRPSDNPLIVHICRFEELLSIAKEVLSPHLKFSSDPHMESDSAFVPLLFFYLSIKKLCSLGHRI